jgi:hypothetical protein
MHSLDFDLDLIRQRHEDLLREGEAQRLGRRVRTRGGHDEDHPAKRMEVSSMRRAVLAVVLAALLTVTGASVTAAATADSAQAINQAAAAAS